MGPFERFYASPLQHPGLLWLAAALALAVCLSQRSMQPSLRRYCVALVALSLADAWLTSAHVYGIGAGGRLPLPAAPGRRHRRGRLPP